MSDVPAKKLVERLVKGDEAAFKLIYEQYWSKLYRTCFYYTNSREDTEDMLIGIFMSLWDNRERIDIENLDGYLIKAAKNQSFKYILKQQRLRVHYQSLGQKANDGIDEHGSPQQLLELKELTLRISDEVQSLPPKTKRIFLLNRERGLTYREIADSLGVSVKTVEYHMSKAISTLDKYVFILILMLPLFL